MKKSRLIIILLIIIISFWFSYEKMVDTKASLSFDYLRTNFGPPIAFAILFAFYSIAYIPFYGVLIYSAVKKVSNKSIIENIKEAPIKEWLILLLFMIAVYYLCYMFFVVSIDAKIPSFLNYVTRLYNHWVLGTT
ncbi:MAG TPA: hypothetical protein VK255_00670 [Patescibacteria group bacterium]|nr:hypothetical protein [Patescibacteria group bacterium]